MRALAVLPLLAVAGYCLGNTTAHLIYHTHRLRARTRGSTS